MMVIGEAGARMYPGRFTLLKSDHFSQKAIAVQRTRHSTSGTYRTIISKRGGDMFPSQNMNPIYKGISYIKILSM